MRRYAEPYGDWRDVEAGALGELHAAVHEQRSTNQACRSCGRPVTDREWGAICELAGVSFGADAGWRRCPHCIGQARAADHEANKHIRARESIRPARPPLGLRVISGGE
jgi:hypothetical protein